MANWKREALPAHIAIIMDGNGRWAKKRGLPRKLGHKEGAKTFRQIVEYCEKIGISVLTVYAFSTENWKRPQEEVEEIMRLMEDYIEDAFSHEKENKGIRTIFLGDITALRPSLQQKVKKIEADSADRKGLTVNIALNYGGRLEIVTAMRKVAELAKEKYLDANDIDEDFVSSLLYTSGQPDPDLIIRPSGERRLSNFLIWQAAYSELVFMDVLWPDFKPADLDSAILQYQNRDRRFGGI